ncbi:unnamed protein product [Clavelina lepadiformis]|uniref:Fibrinogen C-terminal domain-containing protein n=1 Tax=Clavelina lepadiformis TaxID=159417 RepID=A0ABP0FCY6_CLALP
MHCWINLLFVSVMLLPLLVRSDLSLGSCSLNCDQETTSSSYTPVYEQGRTGKAGAKGDRGEKGNKGDRAEVCECQDITELTRKLDQLQKALSSNSCEDVFPRYKSDTGGVYKIYPFAGGRDGISVYCDFVTDGGNWLVFASIGNLQQALKV